MNVTRTTVSAYDDVALMYDRLWADWYLPAAMPALDLLFFSKLSRGASVLDVCCGSGHVTKELVARGYDVTGLDSSGSLIELARRKLPAVEFHAGDVRSFELNRCYDAVLSTFDSLNHLLTIEELEAAFGCIHRALKPGGLFVFDMNLAQAYSADLREWTADIQETTVGLVRGSFDPVRGRAVSELIWFSQAQQGDCWRHTRSTIEEQCYSQNEILSSLSRAGFEQLESVMANEAGVTAELGFGRIYVSAHRAE
jgi:SAM-dependent methyltransferase